MRTFLIAALCASLAYAKPQYNYPVPSQPSRGYLGPSGGGTISTQTSGGSGTSFASGGGAGAFGGGFGGGSGGGSGDSGFTGNLKIPAGGGFGLSAPISGGGTLVQKHIYVHVAPPEPEEFRPQRPIAAGQATKHYKIIFIKAPSFPSYQQQILQAQAQNEEKTLVYVLVKRPDDVADITLPTAAPTAPSKPEVYFIRYKTKSEVTGGGVGATGTQLSGSGVGLGGGASLALSSSSSANSQFNTASSFNLNAGGSSSSVSAGGPAISYGPPGKSGPY